MPEVLQNYIENRDVFLTRSFQNDILEAYQRDFSKYTSSKQAVERLPLVHRYAGFGCPSIFALLYIFFYKPTGYILV
jgi:hypothetical protein